MYRVARFFFPYLHGVALPSLHFFGWHVADLFHPLE